MDEANQVSSRRKWGGLAVLCLALAIIVIDQTLINVSLRTIVKDLNTTIHDLQWVITGYALTLSAFTIVGGRLGDLFGRKRMFMFGALVFACGAVTAATSQNVTQLLIGASVIEGLGAAMMLPATASLILTNFRGRERAIAFGVWGGVAGAAASLGPLVGGYLTTYYTWRYGYAINVGIVALLLAFSWLVADDRKNIQRVRIDFVGVVLSVVGLASVVYGIVQSSTDGWYRPKAPANLFGHVINLGNHSEVPFIIAFGLMVLVTFILWEVIVELRGKIPPLVSPRTLQNRPFVAGLVTVLIVAMGQFGTLFALPVFFQVVRGLDAFHTGLAFLPFTLTAFFVAPISGALGSKKIHPKYLVITGLVIDTIGLLLVHNAITPTATVADLRLPLIVFGAGFGMAFAQLANLTLSAVPVRQAGEASGLNNTSRQIGATLGNAVIGSILITALIANYGSNLASSQILPTPLKQYLEPGVPAAVQSLGVSTGSGVSSKYAQPVIIDELTRIRNDATARAVHHAFAYGVGIMAVSIVASFWLPTDAHITSVREQDAADAAAAQPPTPSGPSPRPVPVPVGRADATPAARRKAAPRKPVRL